ncbi:hypothetical protein F5877DRAFT_78175 [Lentinula edodes]|nr:hypothetical protein F5877DRAFT_78175 [Lentinula edodes]
MAADLSFPESYFLAVFCEAIFHGIYTVLFVGAMYLLLRKRGDKGKANIIMTIVTVIMYCMSTVHLALSVYQNLVALFTQRAADGGNTLFDDKGSPLYYIQIGIEVINCLLGDSIVTWRTWVLWGCNWQIIYLPGLLMLASAATGGVLVYQFSISPPDQQTFSSGIIVWVSLFGGFSFLTNFYAVVIISLKTWKMRLLSANVVVSGPRYMSALLMVIESGAIYCLVLACAASASNAVIIVADMLAHLTGIYPTIIIVLVCLKLTQHDELSRRETTMQFRAHPATTVSDEVTNSLGSYPLQPLKVVELEGNLETPNAESSCNHNSGSQKVMGHHDAIVTFSVQ